MQCRPVAQPPRPILFTAFEPSGDDLASSVIAALKDRSPGASLFAWGGPKMEAAGATIVERTGEDAVVGAPGLSKILAHVRMNRRIARWMDEHRPALHVAVDSPAANFPICAAAKRRGIRVAHLAAPQLWAWAPWRIRKLRRRTDRVLCLLPFEEEWFRARGVPATFIGHPVFDRAPANADQSPQEGAGNEASVQDEQRRPLRLAVMPGSRQAELRRHMPLILEILRAVRRDRPGLEIRFAVQDDAAQARVQELASRTGGLPAGAEIIAGPSAVAQAAPWADAALTKSGTVTLRLARARCPMVVLYRTLTWGYLLIGRWLLTNPHRAMPNLIAGRRIVEEFVPHVGGARPIIAALERLLDDPALRVRERHDLDEVAHLFEGRDAADTAATQILSLYTSSEDHNGPGGT